MGGLTGVGRYMLTYLLTYDSIDIRGREIKRKEYMYTKSIKFNRADIDRLMSAVNTACCALHEHLDFDTPEKARETEASVYGREWRELKDLWLTLYDAREELDNERKKVGAC